MTAETFSIVALFGFLVMFCIVVWMRRQVCRLAHLLDEADEQARRLSTKIIQLQAELDMYKRPEKVLPLRQERKR